MPRKIRKPSQSKVYHVMVRSNERKRLFINEEDRARFIEILSKIAGVPCHVYN